MLCRRNLLVYQSRRLEEVRLCLDISPPGDNQDQSASTSPMVGREGYDISYSMVTMSASSNFRCLKGSRD